MNVKIVRDIEGFQKIEDEWNMLFSETKTDNIFLTYNWQYTWWQYFQDAYKLFIILIYDKNQLISIMPLMISKKYCFRELRFISSPIADYEDILITRDEAKRKDVLRTAIKTLSETGSWDILRLKGIREDSFFYGLVKDSAYNDRPLCSFLQQHSDGALQIEMGCGWDSYYSALRKSFVSDIRAFRKRAGEKVEYVSGDMLSEKNLLHLLEEFMELYTKRRNEAGGRSFFKDERMRGFFCLISKEFFKKKILEFSQYIINGKTAAMEVGFSYKGRFFRYLTAFDSQFKKCSVARLLLFEIIRSCFGKGWKIFDFMLGEESYKRFWNPAPQKLFFLTLHKKTLSGYAAYLVFNRFNLLYKKILGKKW